METPTEQAADLEAIPAAVPMADVVPSENIADGQFRKLDPRFIQTERIGWWFFQAVIDFILVVVLVIWYVAEQLLTWVTIPLLSACLAIVVLLFWLGQRLPRWTYEATTYAVSPLGMVIRRGIWWKHIIQVPRSRIQHTDVTQGPRARAYGIGKLIVYTAGTAHSSVELEGLTYETALRIRDFLIHGEETDGV